MKQPTHFYKAAAYRASEFLLKKRKLKMKHSEALELIAFIFNQSNWQTLNAIGQNEIDPTLLLDNNEISSVNVELLRKDDNTLLPFARPASPWKEGATVFVDPEGNIVPYNPNYTSETIETDPLVMLEARLKHEMNNNSRFQDWAKKDEIIRQSPEILRLRKERETLINEMNNKKNVIKIMNLNTGEEVARYVNLEPKMALFSYVQGLKGFHNTWEYKEQIKSANFIEGNNSIALDDYAVLKKN